MNFKTYLIEQQIQEQQILEATLSTNKNPFGTIVILGANSNSKKFLTLVNSKIKLGDKFELVKPTSKATPVTITANEIGFYVKHVKTKDIFHVQGSKSKGKSAIDSIFKYETGKGGASDTKERTELKETVSMWLINSPRMSEDDVIKKIDKEKPHLALLYTSLFYTSAQEHSKLFSKLGLKSSMTVELQGGELSSDIYELAKNLSGISSPDNWNPGDLWAFTEKGKKIAQNIQAETIFELNDIIKKAFYSKDIVSISLKQIIGSGKYKIVDFGDRLPIDDDLSITAIDIPVSFKSAIFSTVNDFQLKGNMKGGEKTLTLSMESYDQKRKHASGIPAFLWNKKKQDFRSPVYSGEKTPEVTEQDFEDYRKIFKNHKNLIKNNKEYITTVEYDSLDVRTRKRYAVIATNLRFIMETEDIMEFSYYASLKLHKEASIYLKLY